MAERPFLFFGLLPDPPSPASDGHGYAVRFAKKPAKAARKTIATTLVAAARPLLGDDPEIPWRWDGAWLVAWLMDAPGTEGVASEARCAALSSMGAAFTALHEVAPIAEVIYLASAGKGTSPWDAWSWKTGAPSPEGLALLHGGGEVDPAVEKARAGAAATRGGGPAASKAATGGGTGGPGASRGQLAAKPSQPFSVVPLDAKQAPKAPKLVPALKTLVDTLEAARAYGKERIVRVVDAPRGQILWHLDGGWHRLTLADAAGTAIVGSVQTRRVDPNAWERGSIAVSADGSRFLYTDRVTVHEVDVATATSRVVWREERDDLEPGPREAVYVGDAIVVSTLDALWLLEKQANGEHAPVAVAPLQGFSHMTATPDGRSVLVCTFACEDEPPALRVFHVTGHALLPGATLKEQASEPTVVNGRVFAKAAKKPVEVVGIPAFEENPPSAPTEGPVRLVPAPAPSTGPKAVDGKRVVATTALPGGGWLAAVEAAEGHQVVVLDASGGTARTLELPPGFHAGLAVSPDGTRAIVSARRRIDRFKNPGSLLVDLTTGGHEPFGGTTVHAFVSNDVVLAGVALMDVATRAVLATVELPGHRAKARAIAVDEGRTRALIQTSHGDGVVVAVSPTVVRVLGVTPLRPAVVSTSGDGTLCVLADGAYHRVEAE